MHEWQLGAGLLVLLALGAGFDKLHPGLTAAAALLLGIWLVAKDWRDLVPSQRDTAHWRLGLHGRAAPLRAVRRGDPLPKLAALGTALAGLVNLASAVTPNIGWRDHLLLRFAPFEALRLSHAAAVPASLLLFATAPYLWRKREGALRLAIVLLIGLGVLDVLKGLDFEEAAGSFAGAGVLWLGRRSFCVRHDSVTMRTALSRVPLLAGSGLLLCGFAVWLAAPASASFGAVVHETCAALLWQPGPLDFHDELGAVDEAVSLTAVLILASCLWMVFRPLAAPSAFPDIHVRRAAGRLVRRHGSDTLAYFKLRRDQHYLFSPDRRAFLGYRVETGVLLVSGDPVGPTEAIPELLRELSLFAEARGLRIAALGVGEQLLPLWQQLGLRALYLGDEGGGRHACVLARRPRDPQGAPVRLETGAERLHGRPPGSGRARRAAARGARPRQPQLARQETPSVASRCRSTRSARKTTATASSWSAATRKVEHEGSSISHRATAGPRSRCRSCAATARRPTA